LPTTKETEAFVASVVWWQGWEIQPGIRTPGPNDVARMMSLCRVPEDLTGKRILDIGGWNGCCSFECERRGASAVVMLEPNPPEATHFERIKSFLGSRVERVRGTVYDLDPKTYGYFDVVLFFGVVYHLRYPLLGIDNIRRVCRGEVFTESAIIDEAAMDASGMLRSADSISIQMNKTPLLQFAKDREYFNDTTNWFIPNQIALDDMLAAGGFAVSHSVVNGRYYSRATVVGEPPMLTRAHEGFDYGLHSERLLGPLSEWASPTPPR